MKAMTTNSSLTTGRGRPRGLARLLFRAPVWLYRRGLGWLLGRRFLLLTHTGRRSGLPRQTVLEVVAYDPASGRCVVASGFGPRSDWVLNIQADPRVEVQSGRERFRGTARQLAPPEAGQALLDYARRHPGAFRELSRFMGFPPPRDEDEIRAMGGRMALFALEPAENSTES
ncbi:MAG TPA: nitroreductase family deazaflavin-dependent oxidoreductase [Chloroflexi bacterium]|jgi:deazaflavin-dependent oxidoreductase (nitroreductase family)|nr:nitroreductase family deazaflavin-dependent oxidoreductase [Chloroflexota bacterium]